jgi:hypothetical protein
MRASGPGVDSPSSLLVVAASRAVRRQVGPTAWAVLEDVALDAGIEDGGWPEPACGGWPLTWGSPPGRWPGPWLGLCAGGFVRRLECRDAGTGRFRESLYIVEATQALRPCVHSPHTAVRDTAPAHTAASRAATAPSGRGAEPSQLCLLADDDSSLPNPSVSSTPPPNPFQTPNPVPTDPTAPAPSLPTTTPQRPSDTCHPFGEAGSGNTVGNTGASSC